MVVLLVSAAHAGRRFCKFFSLLHFRLANPTTLFFPENRIDLLDAFFLARIRLFGILVLELGNTKRDWFKKGLLVGVLLEGFNIFYLLITRDGVFYFNTVKSDRKGCREGISENVHGSKM